MDDELARWRDFIVAVRFLINEVVESAYVVRELILISLQNPISQKRDCIMLGRVFIVSPSTLSFVTIFKRSDCIHSSASIHRTIELQIAVHYASFE